MILKGQSESLKLKFGQFFISFIINLNKMNFILTFIRNKINDVF